jgi:hypothetical protein
MKIKINLITITLLSCVLISTSHATNDKKNEVVKNEETQQIKGLDRSNIEEYDILNPKTYGLKPFENVSIIPTPIFDLKDCDTERMMPGEIKKEFSEVLLSGDYFIYHGIGLGSLYRILSCYYEGIDKLSDKEIFNLAPWVMLNLRTVLSTTLVYEKNPKTWYKVGFILEVPSSDLVYKASTTDACIPMEGTNDSPFGNGFNFNQKKVINHYYTENSVIFKDNDKEEYKKILKQQYEEDDFFDIDKFRENFIKEKGYKKTFGYGPESSYELRSLPEIIKNTKDEDRVGSNEVAIFHGVKNQKGKQFNIKIKGIVLTGSGQWTTYTDKIKNCHPDNNDYYENLAIELAKKLDLPLYDLRKK